MRTLPNADKALLDGDGGVLGTPTGYTSYTRVGITNEDTAETVYLNALGTDAVDLLNAVSISADFEQPVSTLRVELLRGVFGHVLVRAGSGEFQFSDGSPVLLAGIKRRVTVGTQIVAAGSPPDLNIRGYQPMFEGFLDEVTWGYADSHMEFTCRDLGGRLQDTYIEVERSYGSSGGTALETVMQAILDDNGLSSVTLYVPTSPSWDLHPYAQQRMSVMDALRTLASQIGWDVRYKWDSGTETFRLTLFAAPRSNTAADYAFTLYGAGLFDDLSNYRQSAAQVRNYVQVVYTDATTGARSTVTASDATSIASNGRKFMEVAEASTSNIDSSAEATTLANNILSDLKDVLAEADATLLYFWPVELGDLLDLTHLLDLYAGGSTQGEGLYLKALSFSDSVAVYSVLGYTHDLSGPGAAKTSLRLRETRVTGSITGWLEREARPGVAPSAPALSDGMGVSARVYAGSAATACAAGVATTVLFDTESSDIGAAYDPATGQWTCPRTGRYAIETLVTLASMVAGKTLTAGIYVNGTAYFPETYTSAGGDTQAWTRSADVQLIAGDVVTVRVTNGDTVSRSTKLGVSATWLAISRVR